jgi:serpin B
MNIKALAVGIAVLAVALVTATAVLTQLSSGCGQPSQVDGKGSTQPGVQEVVNANNQFALELYCLSKDDPENEDSNLFFSPYSISTALAMTYEGARGITAEEMQSVFHFPDDAELRRNAISQIADEINKGDKEYKLSTANALWAQKDFAFNQDYLNVVENYYGGRATNLDFKADTEGSRLTINGWVEDQTNDKIKDLIPAGVLLPDTRLVLTNAIYFKGEWVKQFDKSATKERDFKITPNNKVPVPMMRHTGHESRFNYSETEDLQILELPYSGDDISMLIILPKDDLGSIEGSLTIQQLSEWRENLTEQRVDIFVPRFTFETKTFMKKTLSEMGMPTAFSNRANFTGMEDKPNKDLKIDKVIHQAFVDVNEEGTEAAAATAVSMIDTVSEPPPPTTFMADHPFIFMIQQKQTGNILFMGRVSDPRE